MAILAPFRGLRYNPAKIARLEEVVTPPYDVIDREVQQALAAKNPYNMIRLDLSKNAAASQRTDSSYQEARRLFEQWQAEKVLVRDPEPALYLYSIDYQLANGRRFTRQGFIGQVRLAEFDEGVVKPHEKTFGSVTSDRLRLLDVCHAQFSPIFSLYSDQQGEVMSRLTAARPAEPLYRVADSDGCLHQLWAVTDPDALALVREFFRDQALYIADGHHRYTTALQFRALMQERLGELPPESPYNHTMMYLCAMEDPGLSVLPTHRLVRMPGAHSAAAIAERLSPCFEVEEIRGGSREGLVAEVLTRMEEGDQNTRFGCYHPGDDRCFLLRLRTGAMAEQAGHQPLPLRDLDVVVLSDLVLDRLLGLDSARLVQGDLIDYYSDPDQGLDQAVKEAGRNGVTPLLFLMNPTRVEQVRQVADAGLVMPHKSTFFYPKILTGLVINQIVPGEELR